MKGFICAVVISSAMFSIGSACALDMQPGEWKLENTQMHVVDKASGKVVIDKKNSGASKLLCYTPKMAEESKKITKGYTNSLNGCTTTFTESSDNHMVNDTVCTQGKNKTNAHIEMNKVSDTEFAMTMKMDVDSPKAKMETSQTLKQTFVGKDCSAASKSTVKP